MLIHAYKDRITARDTASGVPLWQRRDVGTLACGDGRYSLFIDAERRRVWLLPVWQGERASVAGFPAPTLIALDLDTGAEVASLGRHPPRSAHAPKAD